MYVYMCDKPTKEITDELPVATTSLQQQVFQNTKSFQVKSLNKYN